MEQAAFSFSSSDNARVTWKEVLQGEREQRYFQELLGFVEKERSAGKAIYPKNSDIFNALAFTPFEEVRVVLLGQDPYHGPNQAHGLCFSVQPPTPPPPSLENMFRELKQDLGLLIPKHGNLERWARRGVLLLNSVLTVEAGKAGSHASKGWERFTDRIIQELNVRKSGVVFLLWGAYAQKKGAFVDRTKHTVIESPHPSPLSASRGFFGSRPFSRTNEALRRHRLPDIDWSLEP